jgi:hypothetical protein
MEKFTELNEADLAAVAGGNDLSAAEAALAAWLAGETLKNPGTQSAQPVANT